MTRTPAPSSMPVWAFSTLPSSSDTAKLPRRSAYSSAKSPPRERARASTFSARPASKRGPGRSATRAALLGVHDRLAERLETDALGGVVGEHTGLAVRDSHSDARPALVVATAH